MKETMKQLMLAAIVVTTLTIPVHGSDSDDTLRFYLSKSDLVVCGSITSEPIGLSSETGVIHYSCDFTVTDVLKGDSALKETTIKVSIGRFEIDARDRSPLIGKDSECILFLKGQGTADFWFGIQQFSPAMVGSVKRLLQTQ
jgi:hypothetical protein